MYLRIKNRLDMDMLVQEVAKKNVCPNEVIKRISDIVDILDGEYKANRKSTDMGGYVFLFLDEADYFNNIQKICDFHGIKVDDYEYTEKILEDQTKNVVWLEELYLLSSDDSLVLIHLKMDKG